MKESQKNVSKIAHGIGAGAVETKVLQYGPVNRPRRLSSHSSPASLTALLDNRRFDNRPFCAEIESIFLSASITVHLSKVWLIMSDFLLFHETTNITSWQPVMSDF